MKLQRETVDLIAGLPHKTVSEAAMNLGVLHHEPLLVAMDGMLRYAKAYYKAYGYRIAEDVFLVDEYAKVISGLRALLNADGAVAMERGVTTDSKDNGVLESLFWHCCEVAGLDGDNL